MMLFGSMSILEVLWLQAAHLVAVEQNARTAEMSDLRKSSRMFSVYINIQDMTTFNNNFDFCTRVLQDGG